MAATLSRDDLARSMSRQMSINSSSSRRTWASASIKEAFSATLEDDHAFGESRRNDDEDENELKWAAIERLPTYDRLRKGILKQVLDNGEIIHEEVDVTKLGPHDKRQLLENILKVVEEDNEKFLLKVRARTDR